MVNFFLQFLFLFFTAIFQLSFLNVLFPNGSVNILLSVALIATLTRGFAFAWPGIVILGVIFDMLSMRIVGATSFSLVFFSYGVSFISRRFLMEHKDYGWMFSALIMTIMSFAYEPFVRMIYQTVSGIEGYSLVNFSNFSRMSYFIVYGALNFVLFMITHSVISRVNKSLDFYSDKVVIKR